MLPLFIVESIPDNGELLIEGDEAHHMITVARIKAGEEVELTDGSGRRALVEVIQSNKRSCTVRIIQVRQIPAPSSRLVVVQALTKSDRARETIELLTEGGVEEIIPWKASRSIGSWPAGKDSLSKWQQWAREATKQSRRSWIPVVSELHDAAQVSERIAHSKLSLLFHESGGAPISQLASGAAPKEILLIIGPEGGITPEEVELFQVSGAKAVMMGEPILRSAHAGLAALAAVQTGFGIW